MIIKIESTMGRTEYSELEIISEPINESIIIEDDYEAQGYYPLHGREEEKLLQVIHDFAHPDNDVTFSNLDNSLQENYEKWCAITKPKFKIKVKSNYNFMMSRYVRTMNSLWGDPMKFDRDYTQAPTYERLYKIVTLVNEPRIFRLLTLGRLAGNSWFKYSYRVMPTHLLGDEEAIEENWKNTIGEWKDKRWAWYDGNSIMTGKTIFPADYPAPCDLSFGGFDARERVLLAEECPKEAMGTSCQHDIFPPREWWQSYIDLVQENKVCVANVLGDKSSKPLYWRKMFLTIGGPNWYREFQNMGFKLYDELFDYGFDSNPSFEDRWKNIMRQCDKILDMDKEEIEKIEIRLQPKLEYNAKRIRELAIL